MAGTNAKIVEIAETTHDYAEKAIQVAGALTVVGGAADILLDLKPAMPPKKSAVNEVKDSKRPRFPV